MNKLIMITQVLAIYWMVHVCYSVRVVSDVTESDAGKSEAVRLDLQQQVVHRHVNHSIPEQERSL